MRLTAKKHCRTRSDTLLTLSMHFYLSRDLRLILRQSFLTWCELIPVKVSEGKSTLLVVWYFSSTPRVCYTCADVVLVCVDFMSKLEGHTALFPTSDDLEGAATALMRLQDTYALPTEKIAKGDLQGIKDSPELSGTHFKLCYALWKY